MPDVGIAGGMIRNEKTLRIQAVRARSAPAANPLILNETLCLSAAHESRIKIVLKKPTRKGESNG
jgi:hypothetical protein